MRAKEREQNGKKHQERDAEANVVRRILGHDAERSRDVVETRRIEPHHTRSGFLRDRFQSTSAYGSLGTVDRIGTLGHFAEQLKNPSRLFRHVRVRRQSRKSDGKKSAKRADPSPKKKRRRPDSRHIEEEKRDDDDDALVGIHCEGNAMIEEDTTNIQPPMRRRKATSPEIMSDDEEKKEDGGSIIVSLISPVRIPSTPERTGIVAATPERKSSHQGFIDEGRERVSYGEDGTIVRVLQSPEISNTRTDRGEGVLSHRRRRMIPRSLKFDGTHDEDVQR
eukprot:TRINITY_DN2199_c0_g2_i3.p1 TRINITY_DN2199_c0_g2~~TRINITY_DN2199_c0_g2_i3.p1  ORF type:complete len:279 (+),score=86.01 TRINITY_DN2199_c0_g2_i3:776-1612(+)